MKKRNDRLRIMMMLALTALVMMLNACSDTKLESASATNGDIAIPKAIHLTEETRQLIDNTFESTRKMQEQIRNHAESTWLIHTEEVQISLEEYVMAKNNKALIWALNELEEKPSDDEQLQEMIADRLLASHAKQSGIEVTPDEVHEALDQQRTMLRAVDVTDPNHQAILYIMEQRLLMTGLSEEEFWNSEEVYNSYEQSLYITKLSQQIRSDGNLKGMNSYDELRDQLLTDFMNSRTIEVPDLSEFV